MILDCSEQVWLSAFGGKADKRRGVALIALSRMTHSGSLFQS